MSKNLDHPAGDNGNNQSLATTIGEIMLGEVGIGPKAFYRESAQYLRDPNFLSNHPEYWLMPGAIISQPLQLGWKAVDDSFHLVTDTFSDEGKALQHGVKAITDPVMGAASILNGVGELMQGHPGKFLEDELTGLKDLTIDPIWESICAVGNALHPIERVLEHPVKAAADLVGTGFTVGKDILSAPVHEVEGAIDILKSPIDLITGHPGKALEDLGSGIKHATVDVVKDGYHAVSDAVNGVAHAVFDLF